MNQQELLYWVWFSMVMGIGAQIEPILSLYTHPQAIFEAREKEDFSMVRGAAARRLQVVSLEDAARIIDECEHRKVRILPFCHPQYPEKLREISDPPAVLYCTGNPYLLEGRKMVAIVGSRTHTAYGRQAAEQIAKELAAAGIVVVSGLASGLDSVAHQAALAENGLTLAVMGTGHDQCYPAQNAMLKAAIEQSGVVVSEIPPKERAQKHFFSLRNRIIAALSDGVCVVEARESSGTMTTAGYAQKYCRKLFSVPGSIFNPLSQGTNQLLNKGAIVCTSGKCIVESLGIEAKPIEPKGNKPTMDIDGLSPDAKEVLQALLPTPQSMGMLAEKTQLPAWKLAAALTQLELGGQALQLAGKQYVLS